MIKTQYFIVYYGNWSWFELMIHYVFCLYEPIAIFQRVSHDRFLILFVLGDDDA